jgi:hypothetical protein
MGKMTKRQQFWLAHIQTATRSGESLQRYARRHGLSVASLYNAKSVLKRGGSLSISTDLGSSSFVPVQITGSERSEIRCRLQHVSGWQLEMDRLPDPAWLRRLMGDAGTDDAA